MKAGANAPFFGFVVNFQLAEFDLGGIYECEFLPDFAVAVGDQKWGIGVLLKAAIPAETSPGVRRTLKPAGGASMQGRS